MSWLLFLPRVFPQGLFAQRPRGADHMEQGAVLLMSCLDVDAPHTVPVGAPLANRHVKAGRRPLDRAIFRWLTSRRFEGARTGNIVFAAINGEALD